MVIAEFWLYCARTRLGELIASDVSVAAIAEALPSLPDLCPELNDTNVWGELFTHEAYIAVAQGEIPRSIEAASRAFRSLPEHDVFMRSTVTLNVGIVHAFTGNVVAAEQAFREAGEISQAASNNYNLLIALYGLATMQAAQELLHAAAETHQQALQHAMAKHQQPVPYTSMAQIGLGEILYEWHDLDAATRHLVAGIELSKQGGVREFAVYGNVLLATIQMAQGDVDGAIDMINRISEHMKGRHLPIWVAPFVVMHQTRLLLMQGNVDAAVSLCCRLLLTLSRIRWHKVCSRSSNASQRQKQRDTSVCLWGPMNRRWAR